MQKKSAVELLLDKTEEGVWFRGEAYADSGRVRVIKATEKEVEATVAGTKPYTVSLKFAANGISRSCSCPYTWAICKHLVATAIVWDEMRGIKRPDAETVKSLTIAPPAITRADINKMFRDPLQVDLGVLRIASDVFGFSSRPHSRLPRCPAIDHAPERPLELKEIQKTFREMERWTHRTSYDPYYCAGEMAAAFCELLTVIENRLSASEAGAAILIMAHCIDWFYRGFNQIVDGSDGVWLFPQVRIGKIVTFLLKKYPTHPAWSKFDDITLEVGNWWGEPELDAQAVARWVESRL